MRLSSLLQSPASKLSLVLALLPSIRAKTFQQAPSPNLDLSELGQVALAGDFDGLSLYKYLGQNDNGLSPNGSQSLLGRYPTGEFVNLQSSDASISSMCSFLNADGSLAGIIVAGNFTSLGGAPAAAVALYNPDTGEITPLPGLTGRVNTVFCDNDRQTVYFGGMFSGGNSTNAIAWTTGWTNLPISGFNGPINTITKLPNGHIAFGGQFTSTGAVMAPTEKTAQVVNVGGARISAGPPATNPSYANPENILCQTSTQGAAGQAWLTADGGGGFWRADFGYQVTPSKLRLRQSTVRNYNTKTWRLTAFPINGILNFTYVDPSTGDLQSCTNACPLPLGNNTYQDFTFVNRVPLYGFQIDITGIDGFAAGLGGVELYQDAIDAFAVNDFNEPICSTTSPIGAKSQSVGDWKRVPYGEQSSADYLSIALPRGSDGSDASVTFQPDIRQSGNYSVTIIVPGCQGDGTCATRGVVNVTGTLAPGADPLQTTIYQIQNNEKIQSIYMGYVEATGNSFRPSITLTPASGQAGPLTVVASYVNFVQMSTTGGTLNGLFDYDPNAGMKQNQAISENVFDSAGTQLNDEASVNSVIVSGETTFVGGRFANSGNSINNIFSIGSGNSTALPNGGLNDAVQVMFNDGGNDLYIGGNFTKTFDGSIPDLNNIAMFSISDSTWHPLGAGVDGSVSSIVPVTVSVSGKETPAMAISGKFSRLNAFGDNKLIAANGVALWVPSSNNWLQNIPGNSFSLSGVISAQVAVPNSDPLFAGNVESQSLSAFGSAGLSSDNNDLSLYALPIQLRAPVQSSPAVSASKRALPQSSVEGVYTGLFYDRDGVEATVLGGRFDAQASNGSTVSDLAVVYTSDSNMVTGIVANYSSSQAVTVLENYDATLFVGGSIPGGIFTYDLGKRELADGQPPALSGADSTVNAIARRPDSNEVYVAGSFETAGALQCRSICIWDATALQWHAVRGGVIGASTVNQMVWSSGDSLILAGNLTIDGQSATMAYYDAKVEAFTVFAGSNDTNNVPGPVTTFSAVDNNYREFFLGGLSTANNSAFITKYVPNDGGHFEKGGSWTSLLAAPETLGQQTRINGLQVLALSQPHGQTSLLPDDRTLLVTGSLQLQNYGNISAALFNGTDFFPFAFSSGSGSGSGAVRRAFVAKPQNLLNTHDGKLALGFIVLIGLAIALGCVFLLVVAGILAEKIRRRREGYIPAPTYSYTTEKAGPTRGNVGGISPERLFGGVGANSPGAAQI